MSIGDVFGETVLSGSMLLAVPVATLAGLISFASPCVVPLVPGYLGYVTGMAAAPRRSDVAVPTDGGGADGTDPGGAAGRGVVAAGTLVARASRGRVLAGVGLFVAGFTVVFVAFGVLAGGLGAGLVQWSGTLSRVLGGVVVLMGLVFLGWVPFAQTERRLHLAPRAGLWGAPLLGFVFGLGWAPCIGPTLAAVYTLALDEASAGRGAVLSVAYCLGLGVPFLLVALGLDASTRALGFLRRHRLATMRLGGGLLVLVGLALVTGLWGTWTQALRGWIGLYATVV